MLWKRGLNCSIRYTPSLFTGFIKSFSLGFNRKQAGLSRATLEISYEFSSNFPLRTHKSQSIQWLLRYSTFNILRSSSIGGCLYLKDLLNMVWSYKLKFKIWVWSNKWLLRYSTFNILRLSSIGCRLQLEVVFI